MGSAGIGMEPTLPAAEQESKRTGSASWKKLHSRPNRQGTQSGADALFTRSTQIVLDTLNREAFTEAMEKHEGGADEGAVLIGGGTTVGLQALSIAYALGHRKIHLFGFDGDSGAVHALERLDKG